MPMYKLISGGSKRVGGQKGQLPPWTQGQHFALLKLRDLCKYGVFNFHCSNGVGFSNSIDIGCNSIS